MGAIVKLFDVRRSSHTPILASCMPQSRLTNAPFTPIFTPAGARRREGAGAVDGRRVSRGGLVSYKLQVTSYKLQVPRLHALIHTPYPHPTSTPHIHAPYPHPISTCTPPHAHPHIYTCRNQHHNKRPIFTRARWSSPRRERGREGTPRRCQPSGAPSVVSCRRQHIHSPFTAHPHPQLARKLHLGSGSPRPTRCC